MNRERAKELLPIIQAYAEGKEIQFREPRRHAEWAIVEEPTWVSRYIEYRIKPEKKTGWLNVYPNPRSTACATIYQNKEMADKYASHGRIACIQIEFEEGEGLD